MSEMNSPYSQRLAAFWHTSFRRASAERIRNRQIRLPLARIRRLMKVEEDVRMVAAEVPLLFALVSEVFVEELTLRAWIYTDECHRRILQRTDIVAAIKTSQMYDFLVCVLPGRDAREELAHADKTVFIDQQQQGGDMMYKHF